MRTKYYVDEVRGSLMYYTAHNSTIEILLPMILLEVLQARANLVVFE